MRVLNNRHWVSDVLSGAGIGIFSTELAYGLSNLMFKGWGLKRNDLVNTHNIIENPSFFSISMGVGLGSKSLDFEGSSDDSNDDAHLKFQTSTVVGVEGAYFFSKYIGIGGRLWVTDYETYGELFREHQKGLLAMTLWQRILEMVMSFLKDLAEILGYSLEEIVEICLNDTQMAEKWSVLIGRPQKTAV